MTDRSPFPADRATAVMRADADDADGPIHYRLALDYWRAGGLQHHAIAGRASDLHDLHDAARLAAAEVADGWQTQCDYRLTYRYHVDLAGSTTSGSVRHDRMRHPFEVA